MKQFTSRLLAKVTQLQGIVSDMIVAESEAVVMRSDRAADAAMTTGYSSRYGRRESGPKASFIGRIIPKISTCKTQWYL